MLVALLGLAAVAMLGGECVLKGDADCDGVVNLSEVVDYIGLWVQGEVELSDVTEAIGNWESPTTTTTISADDMPSCGNDTEFFSYSPVNLSNLSNIAPLGSPNPPGHTFPSDHLGFYIERSWLIGMHEVEIVSPGDIWITRIAGTEYLSEDPQRTDHSIDFQPCEELHGWFGHLLTLSDKLEQEYTEPYDWCTEYSTGGNDYNLCVKTVDVSVSAGEVIGTAGSTEQDYAIDVGAYDMRTDALGYANPDRMSNESLHRVCAIDYYYNDTRELLEAELGAFGITRSFEPICGEVEQDEPGTAQGIWFVEDTVGTTTEDAHLSLIHDNIDPTSAVFSVGTSMENLSYGLYYFKPADSGLVNRDFSDVTPGEIYCYNTSDRWFVINNSFIILLELTDSTTLRIESQDSSSCGSGPWAFTSAYTVFER